METTMMENQVDKNMVNDMETKAVKGLSYVGV